MALESKTTFFTSRKRALFFIMEETGLLFLIVLQIYLLLGIARVGDSILFFQNEVHLQNLLWLGATIIFFITLYIGIATRDALVQKVHKEFSGLILSTFKGKILGVNRYILALLLAEIVFATGLALSIFLYLDPEVNWFPYPTNIISFIILILFGFLIYSRTREFRETVYGRGFLWEKLAQDHGPHSLSRITNKKTGSIRIKMKANK